MNIHSSPFTQEPTIPSGLEKYLEESSFAHMAPGEITAVTPWSVKNCEVHGLWMPNSRGERFETLGGSVTLNIICDRDNYILDYTAIDLNEIGNYLLPKSCDEYTSCYQFDPLNMSNHHRKEIIVFAEALWAQIPLDGSANDPEIREHNLQQAKKYTEFLDYYQTKYGRSYELAGYETIIHEDVSDLDES